VQHPAAHFTLSLQPFWTVQVLFTRSWWASSASTCCRTARRRRRRLHWRCRRCRGVRL